MTVSAFDRLELPEGHKEMVKSLVIQHFRHKQSVNTQDEQTDLIQGKGIEGNKTCQVFWGLLC